MGEVRLGAEAKVRGGEWRRWNEMRQVEVGKGEQRGRMYSGRSRRGRRSGSEGACVGGQGRGVNRGSQTA